MSHAPDTLRRKRDWSDGAACAQPGMNPLWWDIEGRVAIALYAQKICRTRCPVRDACLEHALAEEGLAEARRRVGTRGGHGSTARYRIAKTRRQQAAATAEERAA